MIAFNKQWQTTKKEAWKRLSDCDISVFEEERELYKSYSDSHFENLYYGNRALSSEEKDEINQISFKIN